MRWTLHLCPGLRRHGPPPSDKALPRGAVIHLAPLIYLDIHLAMLSTLLPMPRRLDL